jgi:hypothetical protein
MVASRSWSSNYDWRSLLVRASLRDKPLEFHVRLFALVNEKVKLLFGLNHGIMAQRQREGH